MPSEDKSNAAKPDQVTMARYADRIAKLEETVLFGERTTEQLSEEVRALGERLMASERTVRELREALTAIMGRVAAAESASTGDTETSDDDLRADRPPHNSGRAQGY